MNKTIEQQVEENMWEIKKSHQLISGTGHYDPDFYDKVEMLLNEALQERDRIAREEERKRCVDSVEQYARTWLNDSEEAWQALTEASALLSNYRNKALTNNNKV